MRQAGAVGEEAMNGIGELKVAAKRVRRALEAARDKGEFKGVQPLQRFPCGCCGVASSLLAEYLRQRMAIDTIWVSASRDGWSHAWLAVKDGSVQPVLRRLVRDDLQSDVMAVMSSYGAVFDDAENRRYREEDVSGLNIVDITADQFHEGNSPVYVGPLDAFHRTFEFRDAVDYDGLNADELRFYDTMMRLLAEV